MSLVRRRVWLGLILGIAAAGCAQAPTQRPDTSSRDLAAVQAASEELLNTRSVSFEFRVDLALGERQIEVNGDGAVALAEQRQHLNVHYEGIPGMAVPVVDFETIRDGRDLYLRAPSLSWLAGASTEWIHLDLRKLARRSGGAFPLSALESTQSDPTTTLGYLQGAKDVRAVGREVVSGVATTHYRGMVDLTAALDDSPGDLKPRMAEAVAWFRRHGQGVVMPFEVWIDDHGRLRSVSFRIERADRGSSRAISESFSLHTTLDITRYGGSLDLEIPEASQVTELTELLSPMA
jgi:hypothetical protein